MRTLLTLALILTLAGSALAAGSTVADFEGGVNNGDWTWGNAADAVESTGGTPDGWFHNDYLNTFGPRLRCGVDAYGWTGDFVASGVNRIAGDFQTISATTAYMQYYPFTVLLRNHMGTPNDHSDDVYVYYNPDLQFSPDIGQGWVHYDFAIPYGFAGGPGEVPENWMGGSPANLEMLPSDITWQEVLSDVSIEFWFWHPAMFGVLEWFDMGADNIIIEWEGGPVATEESSWGNVKAMYR